MSNIHDLDARRQERAKAAQKATRRDEPELPLRGGGGGGTFEPMVPLKDYVDKADEAIETRLIAKLDGLLTTRSAWAAVATTIGTILGVLLAVAAFAGDRFDAGVGMADQREAQMQRDNRQDDVVRRIDDKLDRIIAAQKK